MDENPVRRTMNMSIEAKEAYRELKGMLERVENGTLLEDKRLAEMNAQNAEEIFLHMRLVVGIYERMERFG